VPLREIEGNITKSLNMQAVGHKAAVQKLKNIMVDNNNILQYI